MRRMEDTVFWNQNIDKYGVTEMKKRVSYNKLWKLLIDRGLKRTDLKELCGISSASIAKMGKNENMTTGVLAKICTGLQCDVSDIMEMVPEDDSSNEKVR